MNEYDDFQDVFSDETGGSLESPGLKDYDNVRQSVETNGLGVQIACRYCGRGHKITLEWHELYVIGSNQPNVAPIVPPGYKRSNQGTVYIEFNCARCGNPGVAVHITPDEAVRHVNTAVQTGLVTQEQAAAWGQQVRQARGFR